MGGVVDHLEVVYACEKGGNVSDMRSSIHHLPDNVSADPMTHVLRETERCTRKSVHCNHTAMELCLEDDEHSFLSPYIAQLHQFRDTRLPERTHAFHPDTPEATFHRRVGTLGPRADPSHCRIASVTVCGASIITQWPTPGTGTTFS